MADPMQQAREQFEAWATSYGYCFTRLAPYDYHDGEGRAAWAAWQAALRAAPEGYVLVPVELTSDMNEAGEQELAMGNDFADAWEAAIETMLAARPQGVKDV